MPVTVRGTDILFNDGTTQSTAAGGAPTTTQVLSATAGASLGAVGTYAFLSRVPYSGFVSQPGTNYAGSLYRYAGGEIISTGANSSVSTSAPAGTWKCMGFANSRNDTYVQSEYGTVFLRIS